MDAPAESAPGDHADQRLTIEGDTSALVPDLCHEIARQLTWAVYGETIIPADAAPRGTITEASGAHVKGGMLISLDPNQPAPEYSSTNPKPDVSEVRLILTQPVTTDLEDLHGFIDKRAEVCSVLSTLNGEIEGGRSGQSAYSHAYSLGYS